MGFSHISVGDRDIGYVELAYNVTMCLVEELNSEEPEAESTSATLRLLACLLLNGAVTGATPKPGGWMASRYESLPYQRKD